MFSNLVRRTYSILKLQQCIKAKQFYQQKNYDASSIYFAKFMDFAKNIPHDQKQQMAQIYTLAIQNQIKRKNYILINKYVQSLSQFSIQHFKKYYITHYLTTLITKHSKPSIFKYDIKQEAKLRIINKIFLNQNSIDIGNIVIQEEQNGDQIRNLSCIYEYLKLTENFKFNIFSFQDKEKKIEEIDQIVLPLLNYIKQKMELPSQLNIQNPNIFIKNNQINNLVSKIHQLNLYKSLYLLNILIYDSKKYQYNILTFWVSILLNYCEKYQQQDIYKALTLLSMIMCDNKQYISSQGLINTVLDISNKKIENQVYFLKLCQSRLLHKIEKRQKEAQNLRLQNLEKYDTKKMIVDLLI